MIRGKIEELSQYLQFLRNCKVVFTSPQGRQVLRFLMKKGCVTTAVAANSTEESLRNQGAQRLVLSILRAVYKDETEIEKEIADSHED